jgi:N-6 DNA Methylase/TaqI-like C-terminal specificity domain
MDLFAASGIDLPRSGGAKRGRAVAPRSLRTPLFAHKVIEEARGKAAFAPTKEQLKAAADYARRARKSFGKLKEEAVRPIFCTVVLEKLLGYMTVDPEATYSLAYEKPIRRGAVDVALGRFDERAGLNDIIAPFELKGPATVDLDAPMPGRGRSPVQQAWDYAVDAPGARWVLVSNCLEIRLYGFGRGREAYEVFDLARLDDEDEYARLWLILSAERLIGGALDQLLRDSDSAYKDITNELYKQYKALRDRLIDFLRNAAEGQKLTPLQAIEAAQKVLDRILFIAFAQRNDLMPRGLLEGAAKERSRYVPTPLWRNFAELFRAVDVGNTRLNVWPYNGGLFAQDPIIDGIDLPDELAEEIAELGKWDYRSEVPVTVLGHIFEQSIEDIEQLKAEGRGEAPPKISARKRTGVVYTPDMVTRFIVEKTIGVTLGEIFDSAWVRRAMGESATEGAQRAFWREYLAALRSLTIVDPACGSGAFLVAAFDALASEYRRADKALEGLGETVEFDIFDEIVTRNLYGVDLNPESVEITRLSLWLKTARYGHRLQGLESTIRVGDSLIEDAAYTARPFDWRAAFPQVFERGGFDIVIGNPPYVRMELIKPIKPWLAEHYVVSADRTDLYAFFYERGVKLLREGGRLGFISSSTFFRTGSGEHLRVFLTDGVQVESVVDFGDLQLFEGVTTYPAILTLKKGGEGRAGDLAFLNVTGEAPQDLSLAFAGQAHKMSRARLGPASWRFEGEPLAKLRDKIANGRKTLRQIYGAPLYGIKTGLNDAFIVSSSKRDRLVRADPKSADLLKPYLRGENVQRWRVEPEGFWLINTPKGKVDIAAYPAIRDGLLPFKPELEKRATKQEWWELQQAQLAYQGLLEAGKIICPDMSQGPKFALDNSGAYCGNTIYFLACDDLEVLSLLNCKLTWLQLFGQAEALRGGQWRLRMFAEHLETVSLPDMPPAARARLAALGQACTDAARERYEIQSAVRRRILDLAPPERAKLTGKLHDWHELDFASFMKEVTRAFRDDIPLKKRGEWEAYLGENAARVRDLSDRIVAAEREIDQIVYSLFDLTPDEIRLLEASLEGQY